MVMRVNGKTAVFYCSVGVRSSRLAERVAQGLKARGAVAVDDLAGGIFAWHGEARPLVDAKGPTDFVHPYDATWGRLLARPQLARDACRAAEAQAERCARKAERAITLRMVTPASTDPRSVPEIFEMPMRAR